MPTAPSWLTVEYFVNMYFRNVEDFYPRKTPSIDKKDIAI
jgi:hypothetical protein